MSDQSITLSADAIAPMVHWIRHEKVMLDSDLAMLYGVETGVLNRATKRNIERFPADFMFRLTDEEAAALRCQIGISKPSPPEDNSSQTLTRSKASSQSKDSRGGRRYLSYAFTEQGVAMLSSVISCPSRK
ncbi:MAG: ORF6N domain-containing protein [Verrucomicrobiota bacterium]